MKTKTLLCAAALLIVGTCTLAAEYNSKDGNIQISAQVIEYATPRINASGGVHLEANEPAKQSKLVADAKDISVTLGKTAGTKAGTTLSIVKNAKMQGPVKMVFTSKDETGVTVKSTASADRADYDSESGIVNLVGNVRITNENPALYDVPAVATGEKAVINLHPGKEGESAFRFRIESTTGLSRIEVTPKQQENK